MSTMYRFRDFRLDPARRELWRGNEEVALSHSAFKCIVYLIENRDRAIGHDELIDAVWESNCLSDGVVAQAILTARHALGDSGKKQQFIKTVRGFGYRWGVPVETIAAPDGAMDTPPESPTTTGIKSTWLWISLVVIGFCALLGGSIYLWKDIHTDDPGLVPSPPGKGHVALLLPVTVEGDERHAWVRLGLMDLIASRLRQAGQAMVPSDTVVALLQGYTSEPNPEDLERLSELTSARLVLTAQARVTGERWTVSLHSLLGDQPPLTAVGEAHDVLEAGHIAADRMARSLGLTAPTPPDAEPAAQILCQKIEAARLAQQLDVARKLIEEAEPRLREHPKVRFQRAGIDYDGYKLNSAQSTLQSLLETPATNRDPTLRARVLNALGAVYIELGKPEAASPILVETARISEQIQLFDVLGLAAANLGVSALMRKDFDAARMHFSQARRLFEAEGNIQRLASLDAALGGLEAWHERYAESRRYFESAAERYVAMHDVGGELRTLANMLEVESGLLNVTAATGLESRVLDLLARADNIELSTHAKLARAYLLETQGRITEAESILSEVLSSTRTARTGDTMHKHRMEALLLRAELTMANDEEPARVIESTTAVVDGLTDYALKYEARARAWLLMIRAHLALGQRAAAVDAWTSMLPWAQSNDVHAPKIYAALAEAEIAAAEDRVEQAQLAFGRALALADAGHVPLRLLQVAESYVPWLLTWGSREPKELAKAQFVASRLAGYAAQHYDAALLQLRVYHTLGPRSAWRTALERAQSLAGERQIPSELLRSPSRAQQPTQSVLSRSDDLP